jgi:DNA-binding GntR family transcriptional regulator
MPEMKNRVLFDLVYERIKKMIDQGVLKPGEKINKQQLIEMLGVSQTPINEALSRLTGEKFIEQRSRQGYFIPQYSYAELAQLFELRAAIEGMAARLCAENASDDELKEITAIFDEFTPPFIKKHRAKYLHADKIFHEALVKHSGNPFLLETFSTSGYLPKSYQKGLLRQIEETMPEHLEIIKALKKRDAHLAQEYTIIHLLRTRDKLSTM